MENISQIHNEIAFLNVNIIQMDSERVLFNKTVLVSNGTITHIQDVENIQLSENIYKIDGSNQYLMPGLIDMHVHLGDNKDDLLLYLVNGVTTIRNMWGYEKFKLLNWIFGTRVFNHLKLRDKINANEILGPTIITAGPLLEGENHFFPSFLPKIVKTPMQAEEIVEEHIKKGYDFIKFYSTLPENIFKVIVEKAKAHNLPLAGHVPDEVGIRNAILSKIISIEHLYGFINPYKPETNIKDSEIPELVGLIVKNNVWSCPTLIAWERLCNIDKQAEYESEPEMDYISKSNKKSMRFLMKASSDLCIKKGLNPNHYYMPKLFEIVKELKRQGAGILLGTDKSTPYIIAGFSAHRELEYLNKAGLSPYESIQTGTINAARCLRKDNEIGTIEIGKKADFILLNQNPLKDVTVIKNHNGVMKGTKWLSREICDNILAKIRK